MTAEAACRRITCVQKRGPEYPPHERIMAVGGPGWVRTTAQAIRDIESGVVTFYVQVGVQCVFVVVAEHNGRQYIKTSTDEYVPKNLLKLPHC